MAENGAADTSAQPAAQAQAPQLKMSIINQFIKDLSFENVLAQKGVSGEVQPDVKVQVNLDARKRSADHQYEVILKLVIDSSVKGSTAKLFLLELEYAGVFHIEGVPNEQMHPFLLIECPRMLFPFVRRIVSDVTRDGGFPPLNMDIIDFVQLYRSELARRQAEQPQTPTA